MFDFVLRKFTQHSSHQIAAAAAGFHKSLCVCVYVVLEPRGSTKSSVLRPSSRESENKFLFFFFSPFCKKLRDAVQTNTQRLNIHYFAFRQLDYLLTHLLTDRTLTKLLLPSFGCLLTDRITANSQQHT